MSNAGGLTPAQKRVLDFINTYIRRNGVSPSYSEMQADLNMRSKASVSRYLIALRERGYIDFSPRQARSIIVLFPIEGTPNWESIARVLHLQNAELRAHLKSLGWETDIGPVSLPDTKKGKRHAQ